MAAAKVTPARDDGLELPEEPVAGPKVVRDKVVRVIPIETVHANTDLVEEEQESKVRGGVETTYTQEDLDQEEISDIPHGEVSRLIKAIKKRYGDRFAKWEPETLKAVLLDDLKGEISDDLWQKILAARTYASPGPWTRWDHFEKAAIAVTGGPVLPDRIQYISPADLARALKIMQETTPGKKLSDEVLRYIAARLFYDQIMWVGDVFPTECQKFLYELGAPRPLVDACIERFKNISAQKLEDVALKENLVDIQVGKVLGIRHLMNS
jgi:hypothetical protein